MSWKYAALVVCLAPVLALAADERTCTMRDAAVPAPSLTYVLCEQGLLLVTADEGATWTTRKIAETEGLKALGFLDVNRGVVAGDGGVILTTADAGKSWSRRQTGTTENLADLQMIGEEGWAAGWSGTILHTTDGGVTWKQVKTTAAMWSLSCIHFNDPNNGFISGFAGQLLRTTDGGATWEAVKTPYSGWLTSITFDQKKRGWITTDDGFLLSVDGGATWKATTAGAAAEGQTQLFLSKLLRTPGVTWALGPFGLARQIGDGTEWKKIGNPLADNGAK